MGNTVAHRFLHIGCLFPTYPKTDALDRTLNLEAPDWIRYAFNNWIVWTDATPAELYMKLRPWLAQDDHVLIIEINAHQRYGWMAPWVWKWIDDKISGKDTSISELLKLLPPQP